MNSITAPCACVIGTDVRPLGVGAATVSKGGISQAPSLPQALTARPRLKAAIRATRRNSGAETGKGVNGSNFFSSVHGSVYVTASTAKYFTFRCNDGR